MKRAIGIYGGILCVLLAVSWAFAGTPPIYPAPASAGGPAGGDLGGTYPNPTVVSVADVTTGVLSAANGGTGNANFAISGPAASVKTYTLPNASVSVVTAPTAGVVSIAGPSAARTLTVPDSSVSLVTAPTAGVLSIAGPSAARTWTGPDASTTLLTTNAVVTVAQGGTNAAVAGITAFNNITGYSATGATGTTSTNIVFSTSPTITTPTIAGDTINAAIQHLAEDTTTAAGYTLVLTDDCKVVTVNTAGANTLSIPTNASVAFPVGTQIIVINKGAGLWTIQASNSGTTTVVSNGATAAAPIMRAQYSAATLWKDATDHWYVFGDIK